MVSCVKNEFCFDYLTNGAKIYRVVTPCWWQRRADWGEHSPGQAFLCGRVERGCLPGPRFRGPGRHEGKPFPLRFLRTVSSAEGQRQTITDSSYPGQPSSKSSMTSGPSAGAVVFLSKGGGCCLYNPRWPQMPSMTLGSLRSPMIFIPWPQRGQPGGSTSGIFLMRPCRVFDGIREGLRLDTSRTVTSGFRAEGGRLISRT
jgi:hypothetical protein